MIQKLIKTKSKSIYVGKDGKEKHYYNYWLVLNNGKRYQIKVAFEKDLAVLDAIAEYVG